MCVVPKGFKMLSGTSSSVPHILCGVEGINPSWAEADFHGWLVRSILVLYGYISRLHFKKCGG